MQEYHRLKKENGYNETGIHDNYTLPKNTCSAGKHHAGNIYTAVIWVCAINANGGTSYTSITHTVESTESRQKLDNTSLRFHIKAAVENNNNKRTSVQMCDTESKTLQNSPREGNWIKKLKLKKVHVLLGDRAGWEGDRKRGRGKRLRKR